MGFQRNGTIEERWGAGKPWLQAGFHGIAPTATACDAERRTRARERQENQHQVPGSRLERCGQSAAGTVILCAWEGAVQ